MSEVQKNPLVVDGTELIGRMARLAAQNNGQGCNPNWPPLMDAFNLNFKYGFRYALSLMREFPPMEALRRAHAAYRPMVWILPEGGQVCEAYNTKSWQVNVKPDSWLWGMSIQHPIVDGEETSDLPVVQIFEGTSRIPFFSKPTQVVTGVSPVSNVAILNPPRCITGDGSLTVTISNSTEDALVSVILYCAEPIQVVR